MSEGSECHREKNDHCLPSLHVAEERCTVAIICKRNHIPFIDTQIHIHPTMKRLPFYRSISIQAGLVILVFTLLSFGLSINLYRYSMRIVAMKEVENKATIFLSALETEVRRLVKDRNTKNIAQIIEERAQLLEDNLNFAIVRVIVRNAEGTIIDHTRAEKIGETYSTEDFEKIMATGRPLIKRTIKTMKLKPGQPEVQVIEALYPIRNRQKGDIQAVIKIIISVERSLQLIKEEYQRHNRRAVIGFTCAAIILLSGTLFFIRRSIIGPVLSVDAGASEVAAGNLETRLVPKGKNEISNLIQSFNTMVEGLRDREEMRQSLEVAKEVQQNLLPRKTPSFEGLDIAGTSIYCDETGGDYYDFIDLNTPTEKKLGIVIGDVSGHGVPAALLMATARAFLRQRSALPGTLAQTVSDVNIQLTRDVAESGSFMSLLYMTIDKAGKSLTWVRAGHDPALVYNPDNDEVTELMGKGIALGVDPDWLYEENLLANLHTGQIIVLGTDGIWETRNDSGEMFGKDALFTIIKSHSQSSARLILEEITASLTDFRGTVQAEDDVTLIVVKITADL